MSFYTKNALIDSNKNTAWMQAFDLVKEGSKVFDVGCSSGTFGKELIDRKGCVVDGIEPDKTDANLAKDKLRHVEAIVAENDQLYDLFPEKYDIVSFIDVIEHLEDPASVLRRIKPMLKKDGVILFSIPNMAHLSVRLALLKGEFDYTQTGLLDQTHLHFYTGKEIERVFHEAGYNIKDFRGSSFTYPKAQVDEILGKMGLRANKKFMKFLSDTSANVYQYVGTGTISKTPKKTKVPTANAHETDYKVIENTIAGCKKYIKYLEKSVNLKDQHISNIESILNDSKQELERVNSKKVVKLAKKIGSAKQKLKR